MTRLYPAAALLAILAGGTSATAATNPCPLGGVAPVITNPVGLAAPVVNNNANFDCLAWQSFITLNWPAMTGHPGVPDPSKPLGTPGPTTWQTFASADQIFLPNGRTPSVAQNVMAAIESGAPRILAQRSKVSPAFVRAGTAVRNRLPGQPAGDAMLIDIDQSDGHVLIDQNGQYVYYEELLNPTEVDYIIANTLFEAKAQNDFAQRNGIALPANSIEVKPAWKVLGAGDTPSHFITSSALLEGGATPVTVGLVGFHIMMRIDGFQQGVWATFAQAENAPVGSAATGHFSFYDPGCSASACPVNKVTSLPTPTQVEQVYPADPMAAPVNDYVQELVAGQPGAAAFGWYRLLNVQWPQSSSPLPPPPQSGPLPAGSPNIATLMNPVLETFLQKSQVSCLSAFCHAGAQTAAPPAGTPGPFASGYSFLFSHAHAAAP